MSNVSLNHNEIKRIQDFLGPNKTESNENQNYYVYALCDNGVPFYIGKGIGTRCLNHESNLEDLKKEYATEVDERILKQELTEKMAGIDLAKKHNAFDVAIIKYGLTEHEAFMAESTAINLLKFCGNELTNIVNGHASKKEKESGEPTKARYINDLLNECCPREITLNDIRNNEYISYDNGVVFISFNDLFSECKNEYDVWDSVRGCWRMSETEAKRCKYVFAMHNNTIKGIFKVKADGESVSSFVKLCKATTNMPTIPNTNIGKVRTKDIEKIQRVIDLLKDNPHLFGKAKDINQLLWPEDHFAYRGFFNCDITSFEKNMDLLDLRNTFLNCYVCDLKMPQISFSFLFQGINR